MLLLLEIGLTVTAWRQGWKGWALLPLIGAFAYGLLNGLSIQPGAQPDFGVLILGDVAAVAILALMILVRKPAQTT
jgi:hypothetical protein